MTIEFDLRVEKLSVVIVKSGSRKDILSKEEKSCLSLLCIKTETPKRIFFHRKITKISKIKKHTWICLL